MFAWLKSFFKPKDKPKDYKYINLFQDGDKVLVETNIAKIRGFEINESEALGLELLSFIRLRESETVKDIIYKG